MNRISTLLTLVLCAAAATASPTIDDATLEKLNLPGIRIDAKQKHVDVDGAVCLDTGALELVACTKNTKEHESLVLLNAKPVQIHTALLLIGAVPGAPPMQREVGEGEEKRWVVFPASGQPVEVLLVYQGGDGKEVVKPIADFIRRIPEDEMYIEGQKPKVKNEPFPTSTFLFMGSHLIENGDGPRRYIAEESGNVISISSFGDEMLGLAENYSSSNGSLIWEINSEKMPPLGTKIRLRLKPVFGDPAK